MLAVAVSRRPRDAVIGAAAAVAVCARGGRAARAGAGQPAGGRAARARDRRGAAAVRSRVAAQGSAAAGGPALALVRLRRVPRGARRPRGGAGRRHGLGGPDGGVQGRAARGPRGDPDRDRAGGPVVRPHAGAPRRGLAVALTVVVGLQCFTGRSGACRRPSSSTGWGSSSRPSARSSRPRASACPGRSTTRRCWLLAGVYVIASQLMVRRLRERARGPRSGRVAA